MCVACGHGKPLHKCREINCKCVRFRYRGAGLRSGADD